VVLSEYVPVAVNCCVAPKAILGLAGVTSIEVSVAPELIVPAPQSLQVVSTAASEIITTTIPSLFCI
jgi:hypothetical protein